MDEIDDKAVAAGFIYDAISRPHVFLQWKGTDACFDLHCKCGAHLHFDGYFAYYVQCPHCNTIWRMPFILYPVEVPDTDEATPRVMPEPDEDMESPSPPLG